MKPITLLTLLLVSLNANAMTLDEVYKTYSPEGAGAFNADRGKQIWNSKNISATAASAMATI